MPTSLPSGSLVVELTIPRGQIGPFSVLEHTMPPTRDSGMKMITMHVTGTGQLVFTRMEGTDRRSLHLDASSTLANGGCLRITYHWASDRSLLTVEAPDEGIIRQKSGAGTPPIEGNDLSALFDRDAQGDHVAWLAVGDHYQPIGPAACFAPSTAIQTPDGPRPAAQIRAGDWVETSDAGPQQVIWAGRTTWPAMGSFAPVRLGAPAFGLGSDLWLMPSHRVAVSGASVEYNTGRETMLIAARHLVDNCAVSRVYAPRLLTWHGILLREHHLLNADGCQVESLFTGGLGACIDVQKTTALADLAGDLPLQRPLFLREISHVEEVSVVTARAQARSPIAA
jgi:hypothetical protein